MAVNGWVAPTTAVADAGATAIAVSDADDDPYAAAGEPVQTAPVDQVAGSVVRFVARLVSDRPPLGSLSRKRSVPLPDGPSSAIQ